MNKIELVLNPRKITLGEYQDIMACYTDGFGAEHISYEDFLTISDGVFSLYKINNEIVATAMAMTKQSLLHGGKKSVRIENVAVKNGFRGNGYGMSVVERLLRWFKNDCYKIDLSCSDKNVGFYEKIGFRKHEHTMRISYDNYRE